MLFAVLLALKNSSFPRSAFSVFRSPFAVPSG